MVYAIKGESQNFQISRRVKLESSRLFTRYDSYIRPLAFINQITCYFIIISLTKPSLPMIKLFQKIRLQLLNENKFCEYFLFCIGVMSLFS